MQRKAMGHLFVRSISTGWRAESWRVTQLELNKPGPIVPLFSNQEVNRINKDLPTPECPSAAVVSAQENWIINRVG